MEKPQRATGLMGYIGEIRETFVVLRWIWTELIGGEGKALTKKMFLTFLVSSFFLTMQPLVFSLAVNAVRDTKLQLLLLTFGALASTILITFGTQIRQQLIRERAWNKNTHHMQSEINRRFYEKSLGQHLSEGASLHYGTIDRARGRIDSIQMLVFFDVGTILIQLCYTFILLWTLGWQIGLVASFLVVMHVAWSLRLNYHVAQKVEPIEIDFRAHNRQLVERWEKVTRVKTSGKSESEHRRLSDWHAAILARDLTFWSWFIKQGAMRDFLVIIVHLLVLAFGVYQAYTGKWQLGSLIPLFAWMTSICQNLGYIGFAERRTSQHVPYIKSMRDTLDMSPSFKEGEGKELAAKDPIGIRFKNVSMVYEDGGEPVLQDLSFSIAPGEKVALIGCSGAGKSTVMKLLLRFNDPSSGEIWINGSRLTDLALPSWMERVGYIPQHPEVFDGTIRYNLTFGLSEERLAQITDEEIWEVMRLLQIDFGARLTEGLDTTVGKNGLKLSGGQAQRLMIGAAVIKHPIFMVIDEATSSLDSTTEKLVQQGLQTVLDGPVGALIVAHRLSTVRDICDRFIVLRPYDSLRNDQSQIEAEASSFEELYERSPTFRQLADDQGLLIAA